MQRHLPHYARRHFRRSRAYLQRRRLRERYFRGDTRSRKRLRHYIFAMTHFITLHLRRIGLLLYARPLAYADTPSFSLPPLSFSRHDTIVFRCIDGTDIIISFH